MLEGGHKNFSGDVAKFSKKKITVFTLKLHDLAISEKKKFLRVFSIYFLKKNVVGQKSKIRQGCQKALLEGVGSIWNGGGGSTPPDTPFAHLWTVSKLPFMPLGKMACYSKHSCFCSIVCEVYNLLLLSICRYGLGLDLLLVETGTLRTKFLPFRPFWMQS